MDLYSFALVETNCFLNVTQYSTLCVYVCMTEYILAPPYTLCGKPAFLNSIKMLSAGKYSLLLQLFFDECKELTSSVCIVFLKTYPKTCQ